MIGKTLPIDVSLEPRVRPRFAMHQRVNRLSTELSGASEMQTQPMGQPTNGRAAKCGTNRSVRRGRGDY